MANAPAAPQLVPAVDPNTGQIVTLDPAQLGQAIQQGYRPPTPAEWQDHVYQQQYGEGFGNAAATFGEKAGSALTFGLSTGLERGLGVDPTGIRERGERNPIAGGLGTVAGIAVPTLLTAGGAGAAEGAGALGAAKAAAKYTAPNLIGKAGEAVAERVAPLVGEGLLGRAVMSGARLGTEGALYGAGAAAEQYLTGDPDLTWEKAAGEVGLSGLVGVGLGVAPKLLSAVIPASSAEDVAAKLGQFAGERNIKAAGAIKSDINRALKTKSPEALNEIGREFGERGLVGPMSTPETTLAKARALVDAGKQEAADLTAAADSVGTVKFSWKELRDEIEPKLMEKLKGKASTLKAADELTAQLDNLSTVYGDRELGLADLHALRKDVDGLIGYGSKNVDPAIRPVAGPLKKIRQALDGMLEEGLEQTNGSGAAWREAMRKQEVGLTAEKFAQEGIKRAQGNNLISPTEFLGMLGGGLGAGPVGAAASGALTAAARRYGAGFLGTAATAAQKALMRLAESTEGRLAAGVARIFESEAAKGGSSAASALIDSRTFPRVVQDLNQKASDLGALADNVSRETGTLQEHAPGVAAAAHAMAGRGIPYLQSKLPPVPPRAPLDPEYKPSPAQIAKFARHAEVAENPLAVLDHAARGTLTPEHVETLKVIYPRLNQEIQVALVDRMAKEAGQGKRLSYKAKLQLSLLLQQPLDSSISPATIVASQMAFAAPAPPPQGSPGAKSLNVSGRSMTPMQQAAARDPA